MPAAVGLGARLPAARVALPPRIDPAAFAPSRPPTVPIALHGETMGTVWRLRAMAPAANDPAALHALCQARLDNLVRQMSHWRDDSQLSRFNALAGGQWASLCDDFAQVIRAALAVADASQGAFSPAMGALVNRWGYGPPGPVAAPPDPATIATLLARSDWRLLALDGARLRQPGGLALDLSGIAKGYAVDALAHLVQRSGLRHGLVEVGGELRGWGIQGDGQPWWVDAETPPGTALPPLRIALHGISVATSGSYVRGGHNLDPATGTPATRGVVACTVLHDSAMIADAWASALTITGPTAMAQSEGLAVRWVMQDGREVISPALQGMIES